MDQITTYATLQSAVAGTLHRAGDTDITGNAPLWIQLCEADLNDRQMLVKDYESEESLTLTVGNNYVAIPSGYVTPIAFWIVLDDGTRVLLSPATPEELPYSTSNGRPERWAVDGVNIRFNCPADDTYAAKFRMVKASNLSVSNTSNYLLLKRPDVYLYGTLLQACLFTQDDAGVAKWGGLYEKAIKGVKAAESRARSMVPLRIEQMAGGSRYNIYTD